MNRAVNRAVLRRGLIVLALCSAFALITFARVPFCPMAGVLGIPCPGCGLTRATLALVRGDFAQAVHLHPLVLVLAPLFITAVSSAALGYVRGPRPGQPANPWLASRTASALGSLLLALTLAVWGARFFGYFGGPAPVQTLAGWLDTRFTAPNRSVLRH